MRKQGRKIMNDSRQIQDPVDVKNDYMKKKSEFEKAFKVFHKEVLMKKKLFENKSGAEKKTEHYIIEQLIASTINLDNANVGEGVMGLITVSIREMITLRDRCNELEYSLLNLTKEVRHLQKELGIKHEKKDRT